ncbi:deoxyribose-phosphate aldolase [Tissierellaceae bacterium BX21]|jgi:deoxyribose-phosphate aldolase|uniref:Deoxyribose-phosphate aldolase n=2 Tax=Paratissierella segnis TaxID=2763679 RepID=A0A926ESI0_9FIRM|nr:deoxyribose-phosphate aldolase [Paratissierella segnis]
MNVTKYDVESIIDASLGATPAPTMTQVESFVRKTLNYNFKMTLTEPFFIKSNAEILHAAGKQLCSVISYPLGSMNHKSKVLQVQTALKDGADELDIAMDISAFKSKHYEKVKEDLKPCVEMMEGRICKLLYFASLLTEDEQLCACEIALELGIPFLKTNPGYGYSTTLDQVKLVKKHYGDDLKIMVSGGVRTKEDAIAFIEAGVSRIATSASFEIVDSL